MSEALKQAQTCLAIHSVNLRNGKVQVHPEIASPWTYDRSQAQAQSFCQVAGVQEVELQFEGETESAWEYRFNYVLGMRLIAQNAAEKDENLEADLEITATFQARYLCKRQLDQEEVSAFAKDNVGYHVWPYWREFVQTSCNRIGLPCPLEVPMYSNPRD